MQIGLIKISGSNCYGAWIKRKRPDGGEEEEQLTGIYLYAKRPKERTTSRPTDRQSHHHNMSHWMKRICDEGGKELWATTLRRSFSTSSRPCLFCWSLLLKGTKGRRMILKARFVLSIIMSGSHTERSEKGLHSSFHFSRSTSSSSNRDHDEDQKSRTIVVNCYFTDGDDGAFIIAPRRRQQQKRRQLPHSLLVQNNIKLLIPGDNKLREWEGKQTNRQTNDQQTDRHRRRNLDFRRGKLRSFRTSLVEWKKKKKVLPPKKSNKLFEKRGGKQIDIIKRQSAKYTKNLHEMDDDDEEGMKSEAQQLLQIEEGISVLCLNI